MAGRGAYLRDAADFVGPRQHRLAAGTQGPILLIGAALLGLTFSVVLVRLGAILSARGVVEVGVGAAGVFVALVQPRRMLLLAFFLLPVVQVTFARGDLVFLLIIVASIFAGRLAAPWIPFPVAVGLVSFAALNAITLAVSTDMRRAAGFMIVTLFLLLISVWLSGVLQERSLARGVVKAYIWSCLVSAVIGILALHAHLPPSHILLFGTNRARAFFTDPNDFGSYLVPAAVILLEEIARPRLLGWGTRRLLLGLGVLLVGIVESFSRDAFLNIGVATATVVLVYALRRNGLGGAIRSTAVIFACLLIGFGFLAATGGLHYFAERSHAQTYDTQRFANQSAATHEAATRLLGHGPGQAEVLLPLPTHSLYIRAFFEEGILGLFATVLLVGGTLVTALRLAVRDADLFGLGSAALLGSWLGLAVASLFVDTVHWRLPYVLAPFIWAAAARTRRGVGEGRGAGSTSTASA